MVRKVLRAAALAAGAAGVLAGSQVRVGGAARPLTDRWQLLPVRERGSTRLGISFRPRQAETLGLGVEDSLRTLLAYPFEVIRFGAYWNTIEPAPGKFCPDELDRQIEAAETAGKRIIVCLGAVKTFGYPEFFVPDHHLPQPLREGALVEPGDQRRLLAAATEFSTRVVERYRDRESIIAWQVEHEATDPLGMEHSWRLSTAFARQEVAAVRAADPSRPIMMNGFLPTSLPVGAQQWWRTRDQGDSLVVAKQLADIVGIDFYPRHAVAALGSTTMYFDGSRTPWQQYRRRALFAWAARKAGRELMVAEGQAEPWETVTNPPNPANEGMRSCLPEHVIENYNQCMGWNHGAPARISAYLFWGAEYWLLRGRDGDPRYLRAFERVLDES
ncbi:MAG TPA: beta-galactosidase [Pseudonocardiaceae bacterium]